MPANLQISVANEVHRENEDIKSKLKDEQRAAAAIATATAKNNAKEKEDLHA